ncbi:mucin-associated surface protein (MASP) [Trypanosoma cruzi]|nr:mucin-associated surface protein (MASP) [Trypanosoma cruzi]
MKRVLLLLVVFVTVPCLFLFLSLYVGGVLVCAEGCTQVTGVMAMMMTGRVLLVCALCVLWCGAAVAVGVKKVGQVELRLLLLRVMLMKVHRNHRQLHREDHTNQV